MGLLGLWLLVKGETHQYSDCLKGDAMPKEIKGYSGRKPPEPSRQHDDIDVGYGTRCRISKTS